jgi:SagB-type dehydrogenase family enzyme
MEGNWIMNNKSVKYFITLLSILLISFPVRSEEKINLPEPIDIKKSLSDTVKSRKTTRSFNQESFSTLNELSTLLYFMQGKTHGNKRAVPSAHAQYPLEIYIIANNVKGLADGLYKMSIDDFKLIKLKSGNLKNEITEACQGQASVENSQIRIIISVTWEKLSRKNTEESRKWGIFEAGLASQNSFLAAAAMGLNMVPVGGINARKVAKILGSDYDKETPIIVNVFGR